MKTDRELIGGSLEFGITPITILRFGVSFPVAVVSNAHLLKATMYRPDSGGTY